MRTRRKRGKNDTENDCENEDKNDWTLGKNVDETVNENGWILDENGWNLGKNDGFVGKNGRELACPLILLFPFLFLFCRNSCLKIGQNLNTFDFSLFLQG